MSDLVSNVRKKPCSGQAAPSAAEMPALSGELSEYSDMPAGSFWMQPGAQLYRIARGRVESARVLGNLKQGL